MTERAMIPDMHNSFVELSLMTHDALEKMTIHSEGMSPITWSGVILIWPMIHRICQSSLLDQYSCLRLFQTSDLPAISLPKPECECVTQYRMYNAAV